MIRNLLFFLIFVLPLTAAAYDSPLHFRHYTTLNGLASNTVRDITQDEEGYIWLATDAGLVRFDGYRFKSCLITSADSICENNYVSSVHICNGELIVGTDTRLYSYNRASETFTPLLPPKALEGLPVMSVRHIVSDKDGNLWVSVSDLGVVSISADRKKVVKYPLPSVQGYVGGIFVDSRNDIWVVSTQGKAGIYRFDKSRKEFRSFTLYINGWPISPCSLSIGEDASHKMWLGLWDDGLLRFDPFSGAAEKMLAGDNLRHVHSLQAIPGNQLLIGSDDGLCIYNIESGGARYFKNDETDACSLSNQFVYPILYDREGGIWAGTFYGGLNYAPPALKQFAGFSHSRFTNSVAGSIISCFCEDAAGNIWIGSDDGGLCKYSPATHQFSHIALSKPGFQGVDNVHALCFDGNDLWIGTYAGGVVVLNTSTGQLRHYKESSDYPQSVDNSSCYSIKRDSKGRIWLGTMKGLNVYDRQADRCRNVLSLGALVIDIQEAPDGELWLATQGNGLTRYNPATGKHHTYRYSSKEGALIHDHVCGLAFDDSGTLWLATGAGICRYDKATDAFASCGANVPGKVALGIVADQNALWITTGHGVVKYTPDNNVSEVYTQLDGLPNNQFIVNSVMKTSRGCIFAGTPTGFCSFYPFQIKPNQVVPQVAIAGIDIENEALASSDQRMKYDGGRLQEIVLSHGDYMFTVYFTVLSYANPDKNSVCYMLEGFDRSWHDAGRAFKATYTNLPPGHYTLKVKGANADGVWNTEYATLDITVRPAWYASLPMKLVYAAMVLAIFVMVVRNINRRSARRHNEELKRVSDQKEKEIYQSKMAFFTMVAHEIRTPLSLIIGPLEKIMQTAENLPASTRRDVDVIDRNSHRLLFLVNQLLDFKKVEQKGLVSHFKPVAIAEFMRSLAVRFAPSIEQRGGRLIVEYPPEDFKAHVDQENVTKLFSNLLNNARKFMRDEIRFKCQVNAAADRFCIAVADNGIGISKENQEKIFKPFVQVLEGDNDSRGGTGLGLSIVKSVAEAHHATIEVESELGHGAKFIVTFPIHQQNVMVEEEMPAAEVAEAESSHSIDVKLDIKPVMLVADDNEDLLRFISENFSTGYQVVTAINGGDALNKLREYDVSIIISDWMMPEIDGVELCRRVRADQATSHIPFIMLTAKTDNMSKIEGLKCGADAYVEKPFSLTYLETQVENLRKMRQLLCEKFSKTPLEPISTLAAPDSIDADFLSTLTAKIEENFANPEFSVDVLAAELGMSRTALYAKIKALSGETPNNLIQLTRLKRAAQLLTENHYRVSEICYMVGFSSSSYFAKCFQKQFGMKPSEFARP